MTSKATSRELMDGMQPFRADRLLTRDELVGLTARSDWRGLWCIAVSWGMLAITFAVVACWPDPLTIVLALPVIAGRQLALAVLEHEGAHGTLFRSRWMNDVLTDWLCARPIWQNLHKYRAHHLRHHALNGSSEDPDESLHAGYPTTRGSMRRKILRDLCGITGLKLLLGLALMDAGVLKWTVASKVERLPQDERRWWEYPRAFLANAAGMLLSNAILFAVFLACGQPWLYGLWVLAYLTPFPLFVRIRSIAEHGMLPRVSDNRRNTRTTRAGLLARLLVAPLHVNYHREHHLLAAVPCYRLPRLHRLLRQRERCPQPPTYLQVLRLACSRDAVAAS